MPIWSHDSSDGICMHTGLITRTGFFRNSPGFFIRIFDFATNNVFGVAETVQGKLIFCVCPCTRMIQTAALLDCCHELGGCDS